MLKKELIKKENIKKFFSAVSNAVNEDSFEKVETLLKQKTVEVSDSNEQGQSAIHIAVLSKDMSRKNTKEMIDLLISYGADINAMDSEGNTPLHYVATMWGGDTELVKFLVSKGANVYMENFENSTPISVAIDESAVKNWFNTYAKELESFFNDTSLGNDTAVKNLLTQKSWFINQKNITGQSAIHILALSKKMDLEKAKEMIDLFISYGADLNDKDNKGNTSLHNAASAWSETSKLVSFMVSKGAKVKIGNNKNREPADLAGDNTQAAQWFKEQ